MCLLRLRSLEVSCVDRQDIFGSVVCGWSGEGYGLLQGLESVLTTSDAFRESVGHHGKQTSIKPGIGRLLSHGVFAVAMQHFGQVQ